MRSITDYEVVFHRNPPSKATVLDRNYVLRLGDEDVARFRWDKDAWIFVARLVLAGHIALDDFTESYVECLLWTAVGGDGNDAPEDLEWENLSPEDLGEVLMDCRNFQDAHGALFEDREIQAGHDFCLTRNGHGTGFWDRDCYDGHETALTEASRPYGTQGIIVDVDPGSGEKHVHVHN